MGHVLLWSFTEVFLKDWIFLIWNRICVWEMAQSLECSTHRSLFGPQHWVVAIGVGEIGRDLVHNWIVMIKKIGTPIITLSHTRTSLITP